MVSMCFCVQVKMNRSESQKARRGQAKSTEAAWEVLECRDCDIMFSRPDNFFFSAASLIQSLWTRSVTSCRDCKAFCGNYVAT